MIRVKDKRGTEVVVGQGVDGGWVNKNKNYENVLTKPTCYQTSLKEHKAVQIYPCLHGNIDPRKHKLLNECHNKHHGINSYDLFRTSSGVPKEHRILILAIYHNYMGRLYC